MAIFSNNSKISYYFYYKVKVLCGSIIILLRDFCFSTWSKASETVTMRCLLSSWFSWLRRITSICDKMDKLNLFRMSASYRICSFSHTFFLLYSVRIVNRIPLIMTMTLMWYSPSLILACSSAVDLFLRWHSRYTSYVYLSVSFLLCVCPSVCWLFPSYMVQFFCICVFMVCVFALGRMTYDKDLVIVSFW